MKIIVKEVGKPMQIVDASCVYRNEPGKLYVSNGSIDYVDIVPHELSMLVDGEGHLTGLPTNFYLAFKNQYFPVQKIVGTVVFARYQWENPWGKEIWDYQLQDITDADIAIVKNILDDAAQKRLAKMYIRLGMDKKPPFVTTLLD